MMKNSFLLLWTVKLCTMLWTFKELQFFSNSSNSIMFASVYLFVFLFVQVLSQILSQICYSRNSCFRIILVLLLSKRLKIAILLRLFYSCVNIMKKFGSYLSWSMRIAAYLYKTSFGLQMRSFPKSATGRCTCIFRSISP